MFSIQQPLLVLAILMAPCWTVIVMTGNRQPSPLSRLHEANIPVILCSSKTSAEMLYFAKKCWGYKAYR